MWVPRSGRGREDGDPGASCAEDGVDVDGECPPEADSCYEGTGCGEGPYVCGRFEDHCAEPLACPEHFDPVETCDFRSPACEHVSRDYCPTLQCETTTECAEAGETICNGSDVPVFECPPGVTCYPPLEDPEEYIFPTCPLCAPRAAHPCGTGTCAADEICVLGGPDACSACVQLLDCFSCDCVPEASGAAFGDFRCIDAGVCDDSGEGVVVTCAEIEWGCG